ncbi:hypothetical protein BGX27_007164 [Mortierella sp. AM989]|nr:hypothetical protein BGX27_007164 [Mortierella sp. AM989]
MHSNNSAKCNTISNSREHVAAKKSFSISTSTLNLQQSHRSLSNNHAGRNKPANNFNSSNTDSTRKPWNPDFTPGVTSFDPSTDYWKLYQDQLNQKKPIKNSDLVRLLQWLGTRSLNRDIGGKINMIISELNRRSVQFNLNAYNDLIYIHILRGKYQDAEKTIATMLKEPLDMATTQRTLALQMAMHIKCGNQSALQELAEGKRGRLMQYMAQFLGWTKGLHLTGPQVDQVKAIFYDLQLRKCPPNSRKFTSLIDSLFSTNRPTEALALLNHTLDIGFNAEKYTATKIMSGLLNAKLFEEAFEVWGRISDRTEICPKLAVLNPLLSGLGNDPNRFPLAIGLWNQMLMDPQIKPDIFSFSSMINGYFGARDPGSALNLWDTMQKAPYSIEPNTVLYNAILTGLFHNHQPGMAKAIYQEMTEKKDLELSLDTYNIMIKGLLSIQDMKMLSSIFERMGKSGLSPDTTTYTLIADTMFSQRDAKSAMEVTQLMSSLGVPKTAITYSAMVAGLVNVGDWEHAQRVFEEMQEAGFQPSIQAYGAMMQGAFKAGNIQLAEEMAKLAKSKTQGGMSWGAYSVMISGYSNLLMMNKAEEWLLEMERNEVIKVSWKNYYVMLKTCIDYRLWNHAERVLNIMREAKFVSTTPKLSNLIQSVEHFRAIEPSQTKRATQ